MSSILSPSQSSRCRSGLRYAGYVGRVGALAVALGVGFAVATTPGIARADDGSDATADTTATSTPGGESAKSSAESRQERRAERRRALRTIVGDQRGSVNSPGGDPKQNSSRGDDDRTKAGTGNNIQGSDDGTATGSGTSVTQIPSSADDGAPLVIIRSTTVKRTSNTPVRQKDPVRQVIAALPVRSAPAAPVASAAPRTQARVNIVTPTRVLSSITTQTAAVRDKLPTAGQVKTFVGQSAPDPTPTPTPTTPSVASAPATFVTSALAAIGFAPSLTPGKAPAPAPVPFAWAVLGFVRRELEQVQRTYFNRTPIARNDVVPAEDAAGLPTVTEDAPYTFDPRANDTDDDPVKITTVTNGTYGTVTTDGTSVTYTPNEQAQALSAGETVQDTFTYTISDADSPAHLHGIFGLFSRGHTSTATVSVTLTGVNDAPTAVDAAAAIGEDDSATSISLLAGAKDPDRGDVLTVTGIAKGTATAGTGEELVLDYGRVKNNGDGTVSYTPDDRADALAAGATGIDTFSYTISDGNGGTDTATVTVTVNGANDAPIAKSDVLQVNSADTGVAYVLRNDADPDTGDTLTITHVTPSDTTKGTVAIDGNTVTYTPSAETRATLASGASVQDTFTYTVEDGHGGVATATVNVTIVNTAAVISTGDYSPVDVELDGDRGIIRNADGTWSEVQWSDQDGWTVGAGVDYGFKSDTWTLDGRYVYADVKSANSDDGFAVVDLDTGEVSRIKDGASADYRFGDVTDVAVDRRVDSADVVYAVDSRGTVYEIDAQRREVVNRADTVRFTFRADASAAVDASAASASPKLAVAPGGRTVYVANGNKISVVKKQSVAAARLLSDGGETPAETDQLVHDANLDISLDPGDEITALEVGEDGTLYATVVSTDAGARDVSRSRLVEVRVAEDGSLSPARSIAVADGARSIAIDDQTDRGYVLSDGSVSVVNLNRLETVRVVETGAASSVAISTRRDAVLVTNPDAHAVSVISDPSVISPDGPIRVTLDWGDHPTDLDAHLVGATDDGTFHVAYFNRTWTVGNEVGAFLNVDDTDGDGPEIIAVNRMSPGTYIFYVNNYSNDGQLVASGATVTIVDQATGRTLGELKVPAKGVNDTGAERYWAVFTMDIAEDGSATITPVTADPLVDSEPTLPGVPPRDIVEAM